MQRTSLLPAAVSSVSVHLSLYLPGIKRTSLSSNFLLILLERQSHNGPRKKFDYPTMQIL
jgi:hypothetical protein